MAHAKSRKPTLLKYINRVLLGYTLLAHGFGLSRQSQQLSLLVTYKSSRILKEIDCLDWAAHYLLHCLQAMCDSPYTGDFSWLHHQNFSCAFFSPQFLCHIEYLQLFGCKSFLVQLINVYPKAAATDLISSR